MLPEKAREVILHLKKKYQPRRSSAYTGVCVGGALCLERGLCLELFIDKDRCMPTSRWIRMALLRFNPDLHEALAQEYATMIMDANDNGDFDLAWQLAFTALSRPYDPDYIPIDYDEEEDFDAGTDATEGVGEVLAEVGGLQPFEIANC